MQLIPEETPPGFSDRMIPHGVVFSGAEKGAKKMPA
jgi:hypothetical protein